jgi:hypothetical protein
MAKSNAEKRAAFIESLRTDSVSQEQADEKREQVTGNNASDNEDNNESNGENRKFHIRKESFSVCWQ